LPCLLQALLTSCLLFCTLHSATARARMPCCRCRSTCIPTALAFALLPPCLRSTGSHCAAVRALRGAGRAVWLWVLPVPLLLLLCLRMRVKRGRENDERNMWPSVAFLRSLLGVSITNMLKPALSSCLRVRWRLVPASLRTTASADARRIVCLVRCCGFWLSLGVAGVPGAHLLDI